MLNSKVFSVLCFSFTEILHFSSIVACNLFVKLAVASDVNWDLEESPFYKISKLSAQCNVSTENLFIVV